MVVIVAIFSALVNKVALEDSAKQIFFFIMEERHWLLIEKKFCKVISRESINKLALENLKPA